MLRSRFLGAGLLCAATWLVACNAVFGVDDLEFEPHAAGGAGGEAGASSSGGGGATGGAGATTTVGGGGTGGSGGAGGMGGVGGKVPIQPAPVVRYYMDEAASGAVSQVEDSAPGTPVALTPDGAPNDLSYVEDANGNRGLSWPAPNGDASVTTPVTGNKLETALAGAQALTIEAVYHLLSLGVVNSSRLFNVGNGTHNAYIRLHPNGNVLNVLFAKEDLGAFGLTLDTRMVLHVVVDTAEVAPTERLRVYYDGVRQVPNAPLAITEGLTMVLDPNTQLRVGNQELNRSIHGTISYFALYAEAVDELFIDQQVTALSADDDTP